MQSRDRYRLLIVSCKYRWSFARKWTAIQMRPASKAERRGHGSAFGGRGLDTPDTLKIRWGMTISNQSFTALD